MAMHAITTIRALLSLLSLYVSASASGGGEPAEVEAVVLLAVAKPPAGDTGRVKGSGCAKSQTSSASPNIGGANRRTRQAGQIALHACHSALPNRCSVAAKRSMRLIMPSSSQCTSGKRVSWRSTPDSSSHAKPPSVCAEEAGPLCGSRPYQ